MGCAQKESKAVSFQVLWGGGFSRAIASQVAVLDGEWLFGSQAAQALEEQ